ncbi:MAG: gamma-glutamyl-gamma-aminobutyrate hydrolase family protein [Tissierellia bacterium]|nr:gamma-glutamyl-gamma-aminobutyrate hydrolase family protein [Tissierellia bacterium]
MKAIIGVTVHKDVTDGVGYLKINQCNLKALIEAGSIPLMLPVTADDELIDEYLKVVDGIYFSGGGDVNPLIYGEDPIKEIKDIDYERDEFEIKLFKKAAALNIPMLGICRGEQVMNVAAGGSLYQDIYAQIPGVNGHSPKFTSGGYPHHKVKIMENSILHSVFKANEININSYHHQAVKNIAKGFKVTALSEDGVIEAIESEELTFAVGIQWHPEVMYERFPEFLRIFEVFVKAASK